MRNEKGHFGKGNLGKPRGATSKETKAIRERFKLLLDDNLDTLQSDLDQLKSKDRIDAILSLARYVVPTLKATEMSFEDKGDNRFQPIKIERIVIDNTKKNGTE